LLSCAAPLQTKCSFLPLDRFFPVFAIIKWLQWHPPYVNVMFYICTYVPRGGIAWPKNMAYIILIDIVKLSFVEVAAVLCIWKYLFFHSLVNTVYI
jgi:hypothetical protein